MLYIIRVSGWLLCVVYATIPAFWLMIHPWADFWRSRPSSPYRILLPVWLSMWLVFGAASVAWREVVLYETAWTWIPAAGLLGVGIWIYKQSGRQFSLMQLGGLPELKAGYAEQLLVTSGLRNRVRHPIYLAHLFEMLGWSVGTGLAVCYWLTACAVITGAVMIRMEDRELERRFGDDFRRYRRSVPPIFPRA